MTKPATGPKALVESAMISIKSFYHKTFIFWNDKIGSN